jgi:hypothetical protein
MAYVKCPFCLNVHNITATNGYQCPECKKRLPGEYVETYQDMYPIWLAMVGLSGHGKTTYLVALTLTLEAISKVWDKAFSHYLDDGYTRSSVVQMRREVEQGKPVEKTSPAQPGKTQSSLMVQVNNVPASGSHTLVMYDVAGQDYLRADVHTVVPFIKRVNTIWFFVSPADIDENKEHTLSDLFESYVTAMRKLHISDLTGRDLLVIYTKADRDEDGLPEEVAEYVYEDEYCTLSQGSFHRGDAPPFSLPDYLSRMKEISPLLREYTRQRFRDGERFISMVEASGMNPKFCITCALPGGDTPMIRQSVPEAICRYRILDPFLWTLLLNEDDQSKGYYLIISNDTDPELATNVWKKLSNHGVVKVYQLGDTNALTQPEQVRITKDAFSRVSLIGPILSNSNPDTRIIVFADNPIRDLVDFKYTTFADRLLVVSANVDQEANWPHTLVHRPEYDVSVIVDALLSL